MGDQKASTFDHVLFRRVMGSFATGVTIITTDTGSEVRGMTANAFMSGSLEPPLCVISVARRARMHAALVHAGHFGVNILAKGQEKLSAHFSGGPLADHAPQFVRAGRTPLLADAIAVIAADIEARHDCGDHSIFIGRIRHLEAFARAPLVVHEGRYASLTYSTERAADWVEDFW